MNDHEVMQYHYEELIKTLIILSSPSEKQIEMMGHGCVGDEMLMEFEWHYRDQKADFFCDPNELRNNEIWEKIRTESQALLQA